MFTVQIETSDKMSRTILEGGLEIASTAFIATILKSSVGLSGAALFGLIRYGSEAGLKRVASKVLNTSHRDASRDAKILGLLLRTLGSLLLAWKVAGLFGFSLALLPAASVTILSKTFTILSMTLLGLGHRESSARRVLREFGEEGAI